MLNLNLEKFLNDNEWENIVERVLDLGWGLAKKFMEVIIFQNTFTRWHLIILFFLFGLQTSVWRSLFGH